MPASPMKWAVGGRSTELFGVAYGTKRKTSQELDEVSYNLNSLFNENTDYNTPAKRMCSWPNTPNFCTQAQTVTNIYESNKAHNMDTQTNLTNEQAASFGSFGNIETTLVTSAPEKSDTFMNINSDDGPYDGLNEYSMACDTMDGEGAVNYTQYGDRVSERHEMHCFGEEASPNSGSVRCYCRPTWDNMAASKGFFSDIY